MPRSRNRLDARRVYFEDEGGDGVPVALHGGFLDSVADVRASNIAQALPAGEFLSDLHRPPWPGGQRQAARPSRLCHGGACQGRRGGLG